jgi:predicted Zn-dependent protease with MMP-like domain
MSRMDRLRADLDRGFEALEAGNFDTAATIVERCRRIDRKNPDVVELSAAVADATGDVDAALEHYRALAKLRPESAFPRICIARIELHDVGDADAALDMLDEAFELIDEDDDLVEAVFIKTEALIARNELGPARETLAELASSVIEDANLALDLADLAIAAEDAAAAQRWITVARQDDELAADCLHALGRVHELNNDRDAMITAWKQVRTLDLAAPPGEVTISEDEIEKIALATLHELPEKIRTHLERVPILIDDVPSEEIIEDGWDPRILGLFQGTPMPDDGGLSPSVTNILLFRKNLERSATDEKHLADEIRITVLHETAHYFGLDEDDLVALGLD